VVVPAVPPTVAIDPDTVPARRRAASCVTTQSGVARTPTPPKAGRRPHGVGDGVQRRFAVAL